MLRGDVVTLRPAACAMCAVPRCEFSRVPSLAHLGLLQRRVSALEACVCQRCGGAFRSTPARSVLVYNDYPSCTYSFSESQFCARMYLTSVRTAVSVFVHRSTPPPLDAIAIQQVLAGAHKSYTCMQFRYVNNLPPVT